MKITDPPSLTTEFTDVALKDKRLKKRLLTMVAAAEKSPGSSLPEQAGSNAALEGAYRFVGNSRVSAEAVLAGHVRRTAERASGHPCVHVIHDTTEFKFGGLKPREGLGRLHGADSQGFLGHFTFCAAPSGEPLGALGLHAWRREGKVKGHRPQQESQADPDRESLRWIDSALLAGELLHGRTEAVHLMDREGDSYELFSFLIEHEQRFVIRLSHDRRREGGRAAPKTAKLFEALSDAPYFFEREVMLPERGQGKKDGRKRSSFDRPKRLARLEARAATEEIFIGCGASAHLPPSLRLNFVEVREPDPPEGEEPVVWRLVTTEPVDDKEQVAAVVDAYCGRWLIEEFFKALKTGCRYQEHQLESGKALLVLLAIETAVAWQMLLLRWLARNSPEEPAERVLNQNQLHVLKALLQKKKRTMPDIMTAEHALRAIAELGGHIRNNGPPGWLVLRRGFERLSSLEQGWTLAQEEQQL
jgi:hypothetical protein